MSLTVVKLGGSSAASADLPIWLAALQKANPPLVLVPGGGPFADQVRDSQRVLGYSDEAAHAMALLAMEQFGHVLIDQALRLRPARSIEEMHALLDGGHLPVWFPTTMVLAAPAIPASWDITSDSLAAWLAGQLDASALLLIKQTDKFSERDDVASLAARGIVDAALTGFFPNAIEFNLAGPRHLDSAADRFKHGQLPGLRIPHAPIMRRTG